MRILCLVTIAACVPSRTALFDPVAVSVKERTGLEPTWRRPAATDARSRELAAAPLTADSAALLAVLASPELQGVYEDLAAAGAELATAGAPPNLEVDAEARFGGDR